jgi:uncharacterized membrane protein YgcG
MSLVRLITMLILLPALAAGSDQKPKVELDKDGQNKQTASKESGDSVNKELSNSAEAQQQLKLEQIDAYTLQLDDESLAPAGETGKTLAVIVNPFAVRKRGWYYGSVYIYHRNDNFDARNFFDPVGQPLPEFKRNQFGFTLGARIGSKMSVFGAYDGLRIARGSTMLSLVPTQEMKRGDFSALTGTIQLVDPFTGNPFPDNQIPADRIHPVSAKMLSLIPNPNRDDPTRNYVNNDPAVDNSNDFSVRVDYEFNRNTKLFGNYTITDGNSTNIGALPIFGTGQNYRDQRVSVELTHSFSPQNVLNVELGFHRMSSVRLSGQAYQTGLLDSLGIKGVSVLDDMDEGYPEFEIFGYARLGLGSGSGGGSSSGGSGGGNSGGGGSGGGFRPSGFGSGSPNLMHFNEYSVNASYTHIHGGHNIAIGGEINVRQLNNHRTWGTRRGDFGFSGYFTGNAFADFLLGIPYTASRGLGSDRSDIRQRPWEVFLKDDWKINRKFTLSMQLTYGYSPFPRSVHDNVSLFFPLLFEPPTDGEIVVTGSSRARELGFTLGPGEAAYPDRNDWQPSFGIAYSPLGNNRLTMRASYNIRQSGMMPMQATEYIGKNYPFFYIEKAESPTSPDIDLSNPFGSVIPTENTIRALDPYLRNGYNQRWRASLEYEIVQFWNLELSYNGSKSTRTRRTIPANVPLPAPGGEPIQPRRPNPNVGGFTIMTSGGSSSSNSFQAQIRRRMTGIFSIQAGFEWSRTFSDVTSQPNNPRNLAAERAYYGYHGPLQFNTEFILDMPVGPGRFFSSNWAGKLGFLLEGWRISGIGTIQNGVPFSPVVFGDPNNDGVWGDRPNRIGSGILPSSERSIDKWFETSDFVATDLTGPDPQWFGNSGRNIIVAPGEQIWDISFIKTNRISDNGSLLELRIQLFNAFNHVNFERPGNFLGFETFGVISNAGDAREIEIAVKYSF